MKVSRKKTAALCIIIPMIALVILFLVWYLFFGKPDFSKYKSYSVVYDYRQKELQLTDEQFQRIIQVYENDTLHYGLYDSFTGSYEMRLYKSNDMSGEYDLMETGSIVDFCLLIGTHKNDDSGVRDWKAYYYYKQDTTSQVCAIIREAIEEAESEQEE